MAEGPTRQFRQTYGQVRSLGELLSGSMDDAAKDASSAKKAKRALQVRSMYKTVIEQVLASDPRGARVLLEHTNAVYIIHEERRGQDRKVLIVYVDEGVFAAELNGRREVIKMKFGLMGEELAEFRILVSRGEYKRNHPFACDGQQVKGALCTGESGLEAPRRALSPEQEERLIKIAEGISDKRLREAFLRAEIESNTHV